MASQSSLEERPFKDFDNNGVWKYLTAIFASLLIGVLGGQFIPNRNVVTTDQLTAAVAPLQAQIALSNENTSELKTEVSELRGELKARDLISKTTP
jgi:hypothetical protein